MSAASVQRAPQRLSAPRCAAWVEATLRYWQDMQRRSAIDVTSPLDVLCALSDRGESVRLLLDTLMARIATALGVPVQIRFLAAFAELRDAEAWCAQPELRGLIEAGVVVPVLWRLGEDTPRFAAGQQAGSAWQSANPVVVLLHDVLQRLPQRLLAVHYGKLLEADLTRFSSSGRVDDAELWRAAEDDGRDPLLSALYRDYIAELNSAALCISSTAMQVPDQIHRLAPQGYLVLCAAPGHATRQSLRLLGFCAVFESYRRDRTLPVNFELMQARWHRQGASTWQREIGHGWVVQAAAGGIDGPTVALDNCVLPLAADDHGDIPDLVAAMRAVARQQGEAAILALLRRAHFDVDVFAAACPVLHTRWLTMTAADGRAWSQALRAVWSQCLHQAECAPIHRDVALCAMRVADWPLAKQAWERGIEAHGDNAHDLAQWAWCHVRTGQLRHALPLIHRASQIDPRAALVQQIHQHIDTRRAQRDTAWRNAIERPSSTLVLEPLDLLHLEAMKRQYRDPQIAAMAGLAPWPAAGSESDWFAKEFLSAERIDYAVMHSEFGFVGHVGLEPSERVGFFVFWMGVDFQGGGHAVPAGRMLCEHARALGLRRILTTTYGDNVRSMRALERIGFSRLPLRSTQAHSPRAFFCRRAADDGGGDPVDDLLHFHRTKNLPIDFERETAAPLAIREIS